MLTGGYRETPKIFQYYRSGHLNVAMDHLRLNKMVILFRCNSLIFTSSLFWIIFLDRSGRTN